jgi:hypothetical protein
MTRLSRFASLAFAVSLASPTVSSAALARAHHSSLPAPAGARASTAESGGTPSSASDMDVRKQCYQEARQRWPSSAQDVQTARDFAYRACAVDHGVSSP